ncbi:MAG: hypothetical protein JXR83_14225 [Deltaproteobacteria bacterium]|nr:hypothetical protein [Deltaproteobacteria bacterium]
MLRRLSMVAFLLYAVFALAACCCPLSGLSACGSLCNALPTGLFLVQAPDQADTALVSTQEPVEDELQPTCDANSTMPF